MKRYDSIASFAVIERLVYFRRFASIKTMNILIGLGLKERVHMPFSSNRAQNTPNPCAYLRVSTIEQDSEQNKAAILALALAKSWVTSLC